MTTRLLTVEAFWLLPDKGRRLELVRGEVVETMLAGGEHGVIVAACAMLLHQWAKAAVAGVVGARSGFILARDPDVVRAPDLYFVSAARLSDGRPPIGFYPFAPDFAVEVISRSETAEEVQEKVSDYLAAGTELVALVYPRIRLLVACSPDGTSRTYREDETFDAPTVLPGFSCRVGELFA